MQEFEYQQNRNFLLKWWRSIDQQIICSLLILFVFSLILVTTSGSAVAARIGLDEDYFSSRQIWYLCGGALLIFAFSLLEIKWLKRVAILGFLASIILLVLVKFYGYEVKGAVRWMNIAGFSLQPSEFAKPFFIVVIGWILSLKFEDKEFPSLSVSLVLYSIIALLLVLQPDFGMLVLITGAFCVQLFIAGLPLFWIMLASIGGVIGVVSAYFFLPHVAARINNFLDSDASGNYQVSKSIAAFEHGGLYGKGPGEGSLKQSLPDSHTDFIFAVAGGEFGAIICLIVVGIFAFIVVKTLLKLINEEDHFVQLAASGIIALFGFQSIINIGVTLNLLPTKGMTLPFISYGGSATWAISISMGMILGFTKKRTSLTRYKMQEIEL